MSELLLVDTSSLTYRAFHALPTSIVGTDGAPINAVRGYLDMVAHVVAELQPDRVVHCWDDAEVPPGRLAVYPAYKQDRKAPPEEIVGQFALLRSLLPVMGEHIVDAPGWEADDAIGTLAAAAGPGDRVTVLTGDRDLIQLVRDPVVRVFYTLSGTKKLARYDEDGVMQKFQIPPSRYVDFAVLRGDPSDGLPGVRGVGPKTAVDLLGRYPDLPALVADAESQTPRLAATLRESADYITAMLEVVPVQQGLDLHWVPTQPDPGVLEAMVQQHSLSGPVERYQAARG